MADKNDIKRLNYFTGQFLEALDFQDEQNYHIDMRRRLNRLLYSPGVVDIGFDVTKIGDKRIKVGAGLAIDKEGRELVIILPTDKTEKDVSGFAANAIVYVALRYPDPPLLEDKRTKGDISGFIRIAERPQIGLLSALPSGNDVGIDIPIAKLQLDAVGNIQPSIDTSVRQLANVIIRGGKVGIGTASPGEKLHLGAGKLQLDGNQQIKFTDSDLTNNLKLQLYTGYGLGINGGTLFYAADGKHSWRDKDANERMLLTTGADGGLSVKGTGTSSFAGKLQLDGNQQIKFTDSDLTNNLKLQLYTGYGLGINGSTLFYAADGKHSWRDKDANERMLLTTGADGGLTVKGTGSSSFAGKLGIGTNDPTANALRVGTGSVRIELGEGKKLSLGGSGSFEVDAPSVVGGRLIVTSDGKVGMGAREPGAKLEVAVAATDGNTKPLVVGKGPTNYLTMLNNGNVGIGATAPVATLQIGETIGNRNNYNHSVSKLLIRAKDQNGGKTWAPTQSVLALVREGVSGEAYGNMVDFRLGRWEHVVANAPSRSQLDIYLTEDSFVPQHVMSLRANGNVGIGTPAPRGRLHVSEPAQTGTGAITSLGTKVTGSGTSFRTQLRVGDQITASGQTKVISAISSDKEEMTVDGAFSPDIATATAFAFSRPALVVKDGNVGIGAPDPITDLQFRNVVKDSRVRILRKAAKDHDAGNVPSELSLGIYDGGFGGVRIVNEQKKPPTEANTPTEANNQYICFHTHLAWEHQGERMRIAPSGNVGIGTSTPQGRLDVSGPSQTGTGTITSLGTKVTGSGTSFRTQLRVGDQITASGQTKVISAISSDIDKEELTIDGAFSKDINTATAFAFSRPALVVKDGNVGIGTTDPGNYKIKVDGSSRLGATDYAANTVLSVAPGTIQFDAPNVPGGRLMINGSTGYVGIGATGPEAKLDVNGDVIVSGAIKQRHTEADLKAYLTDPKPSREKGELYDRMIKNLVKQNVAITQGCSYTAHQESPHLFAITQGVRNPHLDPTDIYICDLNTGAFKTFIIDHPLHKDKFLTHATLEGPEGAVYYRGTTWLENGRALIQLPNYFEALTRSEGRTILLSNVDGFDPLAVQTQEGAQIKDGRFIVVSSNNDSNQAFDWEVKAIRKDVQALEVEPLKSAIEVERFGPYAYAVPANADRMRAQPLDTYPSSAGPQAGVGTADISGACGPRSKITNIR